MARARVGGKTRRIVLTAAALCLARAVAAQPSPGQLDPDFGANGQVVVDLASSGGERASAIVRQADGRLVAGGRVGSDFALVRVDDRGALDPAFGQGGRVVTDVPGAGQILALAQQPDGKLVAAGVSGQGSGNADLTLARYDQHGTLDPTFGRGGLVTTDVFGHDDTAFALVVQPDGKIVAAGRADVPDAVFALARYLADGTLDTTFGFGGVALTPFPGGDATARALVLVPDGTLVAAGRAGTSPVYVALAGYTSDGRAEPTFGFGGSGIAGLAPFGAAEATSLVRLNDGALVLAGTAEIAPGLRDVLVAKFLPTGRDVDAAFGLLPGFTVTDLGSLTDTASALAVQSDGKVLVAGTTGGDFAVLRYDAAGRPDLSFQGGTVFTDFGGLTDQAFALVLQPDGKAVAAGASGDDVALARYIVDPPAIEAPIDIRPGHRDNHIILARGGAVAVAILSTRRFDARTVVPSSVCFGDDDHPAERDCSERHGVGHLRDVNGDRRLDLVLHFDVRATGIDRGDTRACLTGTTASGAPLSGCDRITTR